MRNFVIIAHVDHGKSTLADRLLEKTGTIAPWAMQDQMLDQMELEREKGITIKLQPVRMKWRDTQGIEYVLNLIDTPGHADFQYEVSRSLQAVEGAILLVDATQGIQAQTLSNLYLALEQDLIIVPVINKIDLPAADVAGSQAELSKLLGVDPKEVLLVSAKTGQGVEELLQAVVRNIPEPSRNRIAAKSAQSRKIGVGSKKPGLRALIFDSIYNDYKGVVAYVRVMEGSVGRGDHIFFLGTEGSDKAVEVGHFRPQLQAEETLTAGEIGYVATGLKDIRQARVGDTIANAKGEMPLPGFHIPQAKVFAGIYPASGDDFHRLREAVGKLQLNDASLVVQSERSQALGQGFRCGFLGMLHMEIIQERLKREFDMDVVMTTPSVVYRLKTKQGKQQTILTPDAFPDPSSIETMEEQIARIEMIVPVASLGAVFELMKEREGILESQEHTASGSGEASSRSRNERVHLRYTMPLRELVVDLYDHLKSATSGYGSMSYEVVGWRQTDVAKLTILINREVVEALSVIVPRAKAEIIGRRMVEKLKKVIPPQLFAVPLQATVGGKVVARETLRALRKDVTGYLYGGDYSRKRKLLEKQKKGKKKLAATGQVQIPPSAYIAVLKR